MNDEELKFDRTCHVLYSKSCKKQIQKNREKKSGHRFNRNM